MRTISPDDGSDFDRAWDGQESREIERLDLGGRKVVSAVIFPTRRGFMSLINPVNAFDLDWEGLFEASHQAGQPIDIAPAQQEGLIAVNIPAEVSGSGRIEVLLDPSKAFQPVEISRYRQAGQLYSKMTGTFQAVDGGWILSEGERLVYRPGADGTPVLISRIRLTVERVTVNEDLPPDAFRPEIPHGAHVVDHRNGHPIEYIDRATGDLDDALDVVLAAVENNDYSGEAAEAQQAKTVEPAPHAPGVTSDGQPIASPARAQPVTTTRMGVAVAVVGCALAAAAALAMMQRRRSRARSTGDA